MYTAADVGPRLLNGRPVPLSQPEKLAIAAEWNANQIEKLEKLKNLLRSVARQKAIDRALDALIAADATYLTELAAIDGGDYATLIDYEPS